MNKNFRLKNIKEIFLLIFSIVLSISNANAATVTVTYQLTLDYVDSSIEEYFGNTATAQIKYDLDANGGIYNASFPFITLYENAISDYNFVSLNSSTGKSVSVTGSGADIQIHNNGGGDRDRFRIAYEYNGTTNIPEYASGDQIGIEIDQLYALGDIFDSGALPTSYPTDLTGIWNKFEVKFTSGGVGANYTITGVSSITSLPKAATVTVDYQLALDYVDTSIEEYFGNTATAQIKYDLDVNGEIYSAAFPFITLYENAITDFSFSSSNESTGKHVSVTGSGADIQIHNNGGGDRDRFRVAYEYNGVTDIPAYANGNQIGIEIDQLYKTGDIFSTGALPLTYPTDLSGVWNNFQVYFASSGIKASYKITGISSTTTNQTSRGTSFPPILEMLLE